MSGSARPRPPVVTVGYAAALGAAHLWLVAQPVADRRRILADSSTDVWHLGRDPWRVLPESALWAQHYAWLWVAAVLVVLGLLERLHGSLATLAVGVAGHVVGTLLSELVVWLRIVAGDLPSSARHLLDVGPSYVVGACGFALLVSARLRRRWRALAGLMLVPLVVGTVEGLATGELDAIGHLIAAAVGVAGGVWLARLRGDDDRAEAVA